MFCFSKGKPKCFNPIKIPCKNAGKIESYGSERRGLLDRRQAMRAPKGISYIATKDTKIHPNIFTYTLGAEKTGHRAVFPINLAIDQIKSWSNEGDVVLDPFIGSGTTVIACMELDRHFIGFDISEEYCEITRKRMEEEKGKQISFL